MSTFNGEIQEIASISVDNFENIEQKCYFLSHCHSDHMKSIENLSQISAPLYTTNLSALIVKHKSPLINIEILEYGCPKSIHFINNNGKEINFIVTALNGTGHCLGACMLLFQIEGLDILYTGDFRLSLKHAKNITILNEIKNYKNLVLYLDTTFLNESYKHFPTQNESCLKIIEIIEKHLRSSSSNKVCLQTPARYGYERLLIDIYQKLKQQIFIHESTVYEQYSIISDLTSCITSDKFKARVFLKPSYISKFDKNSSRDEYGTTLNIQLSAMFWRKWTQGNSFECLIDVKKSVRVCYATHNSYSELQDFVSFLQPKRIYETVVPSNVHEKEVMMSIVRRMTGSEGNDDNTAETSQQTRKRFKFKRLNEFINDKNGDENSGRMKIRKM